MWKPASPYNNLPELPPPFRETAKIFRQTTQHVYDRRHPEIRSTLNDLSMICVFFDRLPVICRCYRQMTANMPMDAPIFDI